MAEEVFERVEFKQAVVRLIVSVITFFSLLFYEIISTETTLIVGVYQLVVIFHVLWAKIHRRKSTFRLMSMITFDVVGITLIMLQDAEFAVLAALYLWVIFANGFRYGIRYLIYSQAACIVGMLVIINKNPYLTTHSLVGGCLLFMLSVLPAYVAVLIHRLKQEKHKAEIASKAKSQFVATISHEIRTPLNGLIGMVSLLRSANLSNEQTRLVKSIDRSSKLLLSLLNNVLDISKIEEGKVVVEKSPICLKEIMEDTFHTFEVNAALKSVSISMQLPEVTEVYGDPYLLRQVLANLMGNAVKFTERGSIRLTSDVVRQGKNSVLVRFSVEDTGVGIPKDMQSSIFDSFIQANNSTSNKVAGSGLGLAISKKIVGILGSDLKFESHVNAGTKFWFDLEFTRIKEHESKLFHISLGAEVNDYVIQPMNIAVCEDDAVNQAVILELLRTVGHNVTMLDNGPELLDSLTDNRYELVITDLNLPGMDGDEVLKLYRYLKPEDKETKFILFTADASNEAACRAKDAEFDALLTKPFEPSMLYKIVSDLTTTEPKIAALKYMRQLTWKGNSKYYDSINLSVLDIHVLQEIKKLSFGNRDFVIKLLNIYMEDSHKLIEQMGSVIRTGQHHKLASLCHKMRGNSVSIGAKLMLGIVDEIGSSNVEELDKSSHILVKTLRGHLLRTHVEIKRYIECISMDNDGNDETLAA
jgi:two-component system sensor histidine kinase RpfC